jgi:hypothetical protein
MADDSTATIRATFETLGPSDLVIEQFVQQHGLSGADILFGPRVLKYDRLQSVRW